MKRYLEVVISFFISVLLGYFSGVFITWELNPGEWSQKAREVTIIFGGMFVFAVSWIVLAFSSIRDFEKGLK